MRWQDEAIVLSHHSCGESGYVTTLFTLHKGCVAGYTRKKQAIAFQPGTYVEASWSGREHQLGHYSLENLSGSPQIRAQSCLFFISVFQGLMLKILQPFDSCPNLYHHTKKFMESLQGFSSLSCEAVATYLLWELSFLRSIGYGMDFSKCCVTQSTETLFYVSPKTGRSVSYLAGEAYKDRLFHLPRFFITPQSHILPLDITHALQITNHFLIRYATQNHICLSHNRSFLHTFLRPLFTQQHCTFHEQYPTSETLENQNLKKYSINYPLPLE